MLSRTSKLILLYGAMGATYKKLEIRYLKYQEYTVEARFIENTVRRRIFVPKRAEVTRGVVNLLNEELHNLYSSSDVNKLITIRAQEHVACMIGMRNAYRVLS